MLKRWILLVLSYTFLLTACHEPVYNQTEGNVADTKLKAAAAIQKSDSDAKATPTLLVKDDAYVDTTPINLQKKPSWLKDHIVIRGDQLPFSYYSRTIASGASKDLLTKYQSGLNPSVKASLNYSGTVKGALDLLASKTGYVYTVNNDNIYWQAFITKTFDIAFMPGGTDYLMGKTSGNGSSGGSGGQSQGGGSSRGTVNNYVSSDYSDSEYSNLSGKLSVWDDLNTSINQLLSKDGKVTVSQATTTVTVNDRPTNVELVEQYIKNLNNKLSKQVLVRIQVLEVQLENDYNFGIDWSIVTKAFHNSNFVIRGNYGSPISISSVFSSQASTAQKYPQMGTEINAAGIIPSYTILFNALNQQGKTSVVSEPRVVCLNNQVSVVRIVQQRGYVASIQNTSLAGGSTGGGTNVGTVTSQVTPGTVITGLTLYILPKILDDKVYLQVNADLSTDNGFSEFGSIQLPNITEKHFNQRSMIHSGDTLILSGFRQTSNQANANQFLKMQSLGGKGSQQLNRETIVLITPIILNGMA